MSNQTVIVLRSKLIDTLKENRQKHIAEYNDAMDNFKEVGEEQIGKEFDRVAKILGELKVDMLKRLDEFDPRNPKGEGKLNFCLPGKNFFLEVPVSHAAEYDSAIARAEWDTRVDIPLTYHEFDQFVLDKWDWQEDFRNSVSSYSKHKI